MTALLALGLSPFFAMAGEPVADCVALGSSQEIVRAGGGGQIFLRDGQSHYRLGFARNCDSVTILRNYCAACTPAEKFARLIYLADM